METNGIEVTPNNDGFLPAEVTAPSGINYHLCWISEMPEFNTKLDISNKLNALDNKSLQDLCHERGMLTDEEATLEQQQSMHPIYCRAIQKADGSTSLCAVRFRIRKLTCRETGRLMDIPKWALDKMLATIKVPAKKGSSEMVEKPIISRSQVYKLHGNSIVVNVMARVFENLFYPNNDGIKQKVDNKGQYFLDLW